MPGRRRAAAAASIVFVVTLLAVPVRGALGDILPPEYADASHQFARELPRTMNAMADMSTAIADLTARFAAIGEAAREAAGPRYRR